MSRPSAWILTGSALLVTGLLIVPAVAIVKTISSGSEKVAFAAPGHASLQVESTGRFYVWHDYKTLFEGRRIVNDEALPDGFRIEIRHNGQPLEVVPDHSATFTYGDNSSRSVARVDVPGSGQMDIEVSAPAGETRILTVSRLQVLKYLGAAGVTLASIILVGGAGLVLVIVGLVRRRRTAST